MAKAIRVKYHIRNWKALRNSPEVMADLDRRASAIAHEAGEGFGRRPAKVCKRRARASVGTNNDKARLAQSKDNVLQRALNAGRG